MAIYSEFSDQNGGAFHSYVSLPEGIIQSLSPSFPNIEHPMEALDQCCLNHGTLASGGINHLNHQKLEINPTAGNMVNNH